MMSKPQSQNANAPADDDSSIEDDLKILNEMNIDMNIFDAWSEFRGSFSVETRKSLQETRASMDSVTSTTPAILGVKASRNGLGHEESLLSVYDIIFEDRAAVTESCKPAPKKKERDTLDVAFSELSAAERNDLRAWNRRLSREEVFSRYYFPQRWELGELGAIKNFLGIDDSNTNSFLVEPGREMIKRAVKYIFDPNAHDPKSVLLKRGPVLFDGIEERELLLFTHGFLFSRIEFDSLVHALLSINEQNPTLSHKELREKFNTIDSDNSGELDRCELREMFHSMGVPISEHALSELMGKFDADSDGTITFDEFESVIRSLSPKTPEAPVQKKTFWGNLGNKLKRSFSSGAERKLESAFRISDIDRIESLHICSSEQTRSFANSNWADISFAIFIKGVKEPMIVVCSKPEQREAWVDAFSKCVVNTIRFHSDNSSRKHYDQVGWEYMYIRASIFSLVLSDDLAGLQKQKVNPTPGVEIDGRDEHYGYTALHFAVIMGRSDSVALLLRLGVEVNLKDNDEKTPLDHAVLAENSKLIQLLKEHGAKANITEGALFKSAVEEQKMLKNEKLPENVEAKTTSSVGGAIGVMSDAMAALRERGERLEKLDNQTASLQNDASDYANMAKKLKEKNKKKATLFGL